MRALTATSRKAIFDQNTGEVFLILLEIDHDDFTTPIRVVNNYDDVTSNSDVYTAYPFEIVLPKENAQISKATLSIDNVSQTIIEEIRNLTTAPSVTLTIVLASDPDTIEVGPFYFSLTSVIYDAMVIRGELNYENILQQVYPKEDFNPFNHPGLF